MVALYATFYCAERELVSTPSCARWRTSSKDTRGTIMNSSGILLFHCIMFLKVTIFNLNKVEACHIVCVELYVTYYSEIIEQVSMILFFVVKEVGTIRPSVVPFRALLNSFALR